MANFDVRNPKQTAYDADMKRLSDRILSLEQLVQQLEAQIVRLSRTTATANPTPPGNSGPISR